MTLRLGLYMAAVVYAGSAAIFGSMGLYVPAQVLILLALVMYVIGRVVNK